MNTFNYETEVAEMVAKFASGKIRQEVLVNNLLHLDRNANLEEAKIEAFERGMNAALRKMEYDDLLEWEKDLVFEKLGLSPEAYNLDTVDETTEGI